MKTDWPPVSFCPFLWGCGSNRPLRPGDMLHLVREEILLRPLRDPRPCVYSGGDGGAGGFRTNPALLSPSPPCSLCFSNHSADVPDG